jgi:tryptophanyl-tRNA synthetase
MLVEVNVGELKKQFFRLAREILDRIKTTAGKTILG